MATLNLSTNGPSIKSSYAGVINSPPPSGPAASSPAYGQWAIFSVAAPLVSAFQDSSGKESVLRVQSTGEGELSDLIDDFSEGRIQFAFVKVKDSNTTLPKYVLIGWCGEGVPERTKGYFTSHLAAVSKVLHGYHVQITARSDRDLTPEGVMQKVADASGSKYTAASDPPVTGPSPPVSSKPAFTPTRSGGSSSFNPLTSSIQRQGLQRDINVDEDGWGADAPPVTRSQLEKVQPAYQPTKVNMAELTKQKPETSRFSGSTKLANPVETDGIVRGGYQPVGKVDIAAIRAKAQKTDDDRPTIVKGAYEPIGKVDIAALRAKAQKPSYDGPRQVSPNTTEVLSTGEDNEPKSLAARSAAFTQSERLTSLPKPKVAKKFGSNAGSFTGTKAPTPSVFGLQSAPPTTAPVPVGAASRTFADEGGKTPAQIWAEKKARERGLSGAGDTGAPGITPLIASQTSGGGEWKSGYIGKTWAPVATTVTGRSGTSSLSAQRTGEQDYEEEDAPTSPAGGIEALRDKFKGATPMGAPTIPRASTGDLSPPPLDTSTKPFGGVALPGLPTRPRPSQTSEEDDIPNIPLPPRIQRNPTPPITAERDTSPVRIAMPVARGNESKFEMPQDQFSHVPTQATEKIMPHKEETEEPIVHNPARAAGAVVAAESFGQEPSSANQALQASSKSALVQYDYEKAEENELELTEGDTITNIEMVDEDWWMGTNSNGESGLFPSNYVELIEAEEQPPPQPPRQPIASATSAAPVVAPPPSIAHTAPTGPTSIALYDYEAAEDNELSFEEGSKITELEFPDDDWWFGHQDGRSGLFPANYVQLDE